MLQKKKRWTAAMHGGSQSPVSTPSQSLPTAGRTQWPTFAVNSMNRAPAGHLNPPISTNILRPVSSVSHANESGPVTTHPPLDGSSQLTAAHLSSQARLMGQSGLIPPSCLRNDVATNLLNSIAQSAEFLQQPSLLLQILPQEYLEKYTRNIESRLRSEKSAYDLVNSTGKISDGNGRLTNNSTVPCPTTSIPSEPNRSSQNPFSHYKFELPGTNPLRSNAITKNVAPSQSVTPSVTSHEESIAFSSPKRSDYSSDLVRNRNSTVQHQLASLDFSTASAVANAASLLHSSLRQTTPANLFSPWDNSISSIARESAHLDKILGQVYPPNSSVNFYPDHNNTSSHGNRTSSNNLPEVKKQRSSQDTPPLNIRVPTPTNMKTNHTPRRQTPKSTAAVPTCRPLSNIDSIHSFPATSSWLPTEAADARHSILHDAKIAALSMDWPSPTAGVNPCKNPRVRSSTSEAPGVSTAHDVFPISSAISSPSPTLQSRDQLSPAVRSNNQQNSMNSPRFRLTSNVAANPLSVHPPTFTERSTVALNTHHISPSSSKPPGFSQQSTYTPVRTSSENKTIEVDNHCLMPLKKRLILRYEADNGSCCSESTPPPPKISSLEASSIPVTNQAQQNRLPASSPRSPVNKHGVQHGKMTDLPTGQTRKMHKSPEPTDRTISQGDQKTTKRLTGPDLVDGRNGGLRKGVSRRIANKLAPSEAKSVRKSINRRRSGQSSSDGTQNPPRCSPINGSRLFRTASSTASSGSIDNVYDSDDGPGNFSHFPDAKSTVKSSTFAERSRKPKRAAALIASAATASASMKAKRSRRDMEPSAEDESFDTDDSSSIMTTESSGLPTADLTSPMLDELSAIMSEETLSLEEVIQNLPGPPDLQQLTTRSLHPAHTMDHYKRTRIPFVQLVSCNDAALKPIPKCRACRQLKRSTHYELNDPDLATGSDEGSHQDAEPFKHPSSVSNPPSDGGKSSKKRPPASSPVAVFCRFWGFRRLAFNQRGVLKITGFCQANEASDVDRSLWEMHHSVSPHLDVDNAKYIIERSGTLFCRLLRQELAILTGQGNPTESTPASKNGLRRGGNRQSANSRSVAWKRPVKGVREMCDVCETTMFNTHWVCAKCGYSVCVDCQEEAKADKRRKLETTGGPAATELDTSGDKPKCKQPRARAGPPGWASCTTTRQHHDPGHLILTSLLPASTIGQLLHRVHRIARHYEIRLGCGCPLLELRDSPVETQKLLANISLKSEDLSGTSSLKRDPWNESGYPPHTWIRKPYPVSARKMDLDDSASKYRILQLHNPSHVGNLEAFQHQWQRNRPVVIAGCQGRFDRSLWSPQSFADEFGALRTTLVDCASGVELTRYPMKTFWDGFERKSRRLVSKDGRALCLKLKDWPATEDFAELQPQRFSNLIDNLPLPCYTCRDGQLNLSARLASFFVRPDLGPKLYVAYGTGGSRLMGTTNLHVDIADAMNIMLYVGYPNDSAEDSCANAEAVLNVMRQAQLDPVYLERATRWLKFVQTATDVDETSREKIENDVPGALWHIFLPEDMPVLREFLTRITEEETGAPIEAGSDPVHDQLFYLDQPLLDRLYTESGVLPCTLIQFHGDAVFIPAGAAHQVRNLNSCIKAAVDFVSPEHVPQCIQLIEEFRRLSSTHQNHEDKLQVKNMLFHATKDALSTLLCSGNPVKKLGVEKKPDDIDSDASSGCHHHQQQSNSRSTRTRSSRAPKPEEYEMSCKQPTDPSAP